MAFFSNLNSGNPALYLAENLPGDTGWCAYLLPAGSSAGSELDLATSFNDLPGSYLFSYTDIRVSGDALVESVRRYMAQKISPNRAILWTNQPTGTADLEFNGMGFSLQPIRIGPSSKIFTVTNALVGWASDILELSIPGNCEVSLDAASAAIRIDGNTASSGPITFNTIDGIAQTEIDPNRGQIFFSGPGRGCIIFELYIRQGTDFDIFDFGLKYFIPAEQGDTRLQRYPLLRSDVPTQDARVGFRTWLDLTNIQNDGGVLRTFFAFTGKNKNGLPTLLPSTYTTAFGHAVNLTPQAQLGPSFQLPGAGSALMIFQANPRLGQNRYLAPAGNFAMTLADGGLQGQALCGLSGTESIAFTSGDLLQFSAGHEAYAPVFPFPLASPVGPPVDPAASLLSSRFTTSWATIVKARSSSSDPVYMAQPKGSALFGRDTLINKSFPSLLGHRDPAYIVPQQEGFSFPMAPYSAVVIKDDGTTFTRNELESFELQVLGPTRRSRIGDSRPGMRASAAFHDNVGAPENVTTPSGIIATIDTSMPAGAWTRILLGQVKNGTLQQISFENPDPQLVQAFQTSQIFLVAANACHLGKLAGGGAAPPCPVDPSRSFQNLVEIGGWKLAAEVGQNSRYADYRDVLIFKGTRGKLYDPPPDSIDDTVSLVANPSKWTQRGDFSSPTVRAGETEKTLQPPDESQQVILSQWLQDYFRDVRVRAGDPEQKQYFQKLDQIARDENWTGFLILKMTIQDLPRDLAGIAAGIANKEAFNAHHFGIEISQVQNQPGQPIQLNDSSSMFGLIYYSDPDFTLPAPDQPPAPVPPAPGVDYDFRLLMLRVLFENTSVKSFQSYVQITLNKLFGMSVDHMGNGGNSFNSIVLSGSYQNNNGQPVYSLGSTSDSTYYFDHNVIQKVELTSALMSTRNPGNQPTNPTVISWIGFTGFIDFKIVRGPQNESGENQATGPGEPFDILSFGNDEGQDLLRKGLSFSNLGLKMSFPVSDPAKRDIDFSAGEISFDLATSTPREGSLFSGFSLQIQSLQQGTKDSPPSRSGYATVITDARLNGVDGDDWWGIRYQLNMGTPGNLAGNLGLNSFLLTGWAPESSGEDGYKALVGLQLPGTGGGAKLISLQNVLRLSIGQMRLTLDRSNPEEPIKPFLLMLTEIALKFLGLLKIPPSGSTLFYLFGNPKSDGRPSGLGWYAMYNREVKEKVEGTLYEQRSASY